MSEAKSAVSAANNDQVQDTAIQQSQSVTGEIVPFPATSTSATPTSTPRHKVPQNNGNWREYSMTVEAYELIHETINIYEDAAHRKQRECRRNHLPLPAIQDIAARLERQVTVEDINWLIWLDGDPVVCSWTGREFQPVCRVIINDKVLNAIARRKTLDEGVLQSCNAEVAGQYFPNPNRESTEFYAICGVPYFWTKGEENLSADWSPLRKVWRLNKERWGDSRAVASQIIEERDALNKEAQTLQDGLNRMEEIFKGKSGQHHDRRQFRSSR